MKKLKKSNNKPFRSFNDVLMKVEWNTIPSFIKLNQIVNENNKNDLYQIKAS